MLGLRSISALLNSLNEIPGDWLKIISREGRGTTVILTVIDQKVQSFIEQEGKINEPYKLIPKKSI